MSADRDYWTELKQLLRWFITPGITSPGLSGSFGLVQLVRAHAAFLGSYQFVGVRLGLSGLVLVHPGSSSSSGLVWFVLACSGSSGLARAHPGLSMKLLDGAEVIS